ncbi:high-affinity choline transporter 1-like [Mytilus trossulus]|uniref:high-affinity choline transporter 1-like n=1 Tax=Mytilus trossulus TaxID=6551 RepID=UPI003003F814
MTINVVGLVVLLVFYIVILIVGVAAARRKKMSTKVTAMESSIVAGRDLNTVVGIFTVTATTVGGGYINGTAESIATSGLVWTLAPFGIFIGLILGGLLFAKKMRDHNYLTMLDPCQEVYGNALVFMVYLASLCGDIFWTASILSALGTSLSVIVNIPLTVAIVTSSAVTIIYTMIGQMISVAYTDIVQLMFITFGLVLSLPFILTNENVGDISISADTWVGTFDISFAGQWWDLFVAMTLGTIPWQSYFQRVLSVRSGRQAQMLSVVGACSAVILVIPSVVIGAVATNADWNKTSLGQSPMDLNQGSMVLPLVLQNFTPNIVAVIGLGAISAAVMSSMDSSILGSSSMFTYNIYAQLFRTKASDSELLWIQRLAILFVGTLATVISIFVPIVYGLFILAADIVFVIVLPQLLCAVYFKWTNSYGAIVGYLVSVTLRIGAGEPTINFPAFIFYPDYDVETGQNFPFRTFAFVTSVLCIVMVSIITRCSQKIVKSKTKYNVSKASGSKSNKNILKVQTLNGQ